VVHRVLELAGRKAQAAEAYLEETEGRPIDFENNQLKYITTKSRRALSLRVIHDGRLGFASTTDPSDPERLVSRALESARFGQEARFEFPGQAALPEVAVHDGQVADFAVERGVELGRDAIDAVRAEFDDVQCGAEITRWVGRTRVANTSGLDASVDLTGFDAELSGVRVRDGSILWVWEGESSRRLVVDFERYVAEVLADLRAAETEVEAPGGELPVLFTARAMGMLLGIVQHAVNGKLVQRGASPLTGRLGEAVLDERVSLADDGTVDFADGSCPFDGEGVPSRRTPLFERGVLRSYLFDLQTAGVLGAETTGNAGRGFAAPPQPDATNLVLEPGTETFDGMLAGIERGLLVDEVIGGGQSNVLAGEFSVNVGLGFLVEQGERVGRVKDCMVAGNVFELFRRVRGIGSKQETHGSIIAPAVCFDAASVAGAE
jgi:PmbA protein